MITLSEREQLEARADEVWKCVQQQDLIIKQLEAKYRKIRDKLICFNRDIKTNCAQYELEQSKKTRKALSEYSDSLRVRMINAKNN